MDAVDILISKADLTAPMVVRVPPAPLAEGEARLRIELLALTANTVTYAVAGDAFGYWRFFPASEGFGKPPAWGFAVVEESRAQGVAAGERIYGFFPVASHLTVVPGKTDTLGFTDLAAHRQGLSPVYNRYHRVASDPSYRADDEPLLAAFRPLFTTAFLLNAMLVRANAFGAERVIVSSASSKTGYALGYLMGLGGLETVGLTSAANRGFVEGLGIFHETRAYEEIAFLNPAAPSVYIDLAGAAAITRSVHAHLGDALTHSAVVGMTHWTAPRGWDAPSGVTPTLFFAPDHAIGLTREWGAEAFEARLADGMGAFLGFVAPILRKRCAQGPAAAAEAFAQTAGGAVDPSEILTVRV